MQIVKKNGKIESFDLSKISTSIENSAEDISYTLTDADSNMILKQVKEILDSLNNENKMTSTFEIRGIIYYVLIENKFTNLCKAYMNL